MVNRLALVDLKGFLGDPSAVNLSQLVSIPVLYQVLKDEEVKNNGKYPMTVMSLCRWIYDLANEVLARLCLHSVSADDFVLDPKAPDWKVVRSYVCDFVISLLINKL